MRRGFHYLVAIMDWSTRKVLSWRVSNTMDGEFCIEALEDALARFGCPEIFNTDQGSQLTSPRFTGVLETAGARISLDGCGRWMDNVFIERLWRSLKYECIYLNAFETGSELRAGLTWWIDYYNARRPHSMLAGSRAVTRLRRLFGHPSWRPGSHARSDQARPAADRRRSEGTGLSSHQSRVAGGSLRGLRHQLMTDAGVTPG